MDWNGNLRSAFVPPRLDNNFFYNYDYNQFPVIDTKHSVQAPHAAIPIMDKNNYGKKKGKKRLTRNQVKALENSFQEEMKMEPDRKMELAKELGLQPREIAIWFQNRRARWKAKQLEHLYDSLKQEFDVVSKEKQKLQEEVLALRGILKEQAAKKQVSTGYTTKVSSEETVKITSVPSSNKPQGTSNNQMDCEDVFNVDDYNSVMQPYWIGLPSFQ